MAIMPKVTANNNRVLLVRLIDFVPENLVMEDALTVFTMVNDTSIMTKDKGELISGEIVIFDLKGLTAKHLPRIGLSTLRCFIRYMIDAHPLRIKQVHVVNSNSLLDKLVMIMKPFVGAKAMKVIHFHLPNTKTLYEFVPRDCLPHEFGGTFGVIDTPKWFWINRTDDHRRVD